MSLIAVQRNVIFKLLTGSIPHRGLLFRIFPSKFDSPKCHICKTSIESAQHLLFFCPSKAFVWENIINEFLWTAIRVEDVIEAIIFLDFEKWVIVRKKIQLQE